MDKKRVNTLKKLAMRWRFRLDHARAIFGLITFAAILAAQYIKYIPFFEKLGLWGVVILTLLAFILFAVGGYAYDRWFKFWEPHSFVNIERNPYNYIPVPKELIVTKAKDFVLLYLLAILSDDERLSKDFAIILDEYYSLELTDSHYREKAVAISKLSRELIINLKEKMKDGD